MEKPVTKDELGPKIEVLVVSQSQKNRIDFSKINSIVNINFHGF